MNAAAATAFTLVMLLGMTGIAAHTWHERRHTIPTPEKVDTGTQSWTVWEHTVTSLGHPAEIDFTIPDCPPWPTWHTIPDSRYQTAIAALANEH